MPRSPWNNEITTVTRQRRNSRGVMDTNFRTDEISGEVRHHRYQSDYYGEREYVKVDIHMNKGEWFDKTPAAKVDARYFADGEFVAIRAGNDATVFMSVDQAKALQASLNEAMDSVG